jgi:hypothetical protein
MTEKVKWEVVDEAAAKEKPAANKLFGPWWRWKLAGLLAFGALCLLMLIALAGMLALALASVALLSFGVARLTQWLRGGRAHSTAVRDPDSRRQQ